MLKIFYLFQRIFSLISRPNRKRIILSLFLGLLNSVIDVLVLSSIFPAVYIATNPHLIHQNKILSTIYDQFHFSNESHFILCMLFFILSLFLFRTIIFTVILKHQQRTSFDITYEFIDLMSRLFFRRSILDIKKQSIGELNKEIQVLPLQFVSYILLPLTLMVSEIAIIILIITGIVSYNPQLFLLIAITLFPFMIILYRFLYKKTKQLGFASNEASTEAFNHTQNIVRGYIDIKTHSKETFFINRLISAMKRYNHIQATLNTYQQIPPKLLELFAILSITGIYFYVYLSEQPKSEIVLILAIYLASAYRLLPSLNRIHFSLLLIKQYEFILEIFENAKKQIQKLTASAPPNTSLSLSFQKQICLQNISLSYSREPHHFVLKDINICFRKSEMIGLVGPSGAGKSSLVYILSGLLTPTQGKIIIDETELNAQNIHEWQKQISFVPQDIFLINDSILANIAFGENEQDRDINKAWNCLKSVQLEEFVKSLPQNIYTPVGEGGGYLSGGQKQRLVIARALYQNSSLIIMDEATSALDEHTQDGLMLAIHQIAQQYALTVLLIAHRISSLKYCHRILKLENGRITQELSYNELKENILV